jgi:hypothetical protein
MGVAHFYTSPFQAAIQRKCATHSSMKWSLSSSPLSVVLIFRSWTYLLLIFASYRIDLRFIDHDFSSIDAQMCRYYNPKFFLSIILRKIYDSSINNALEHVQIYSDRIQLIHRLSKSRHLMILHKRSTIVKMKSIHGNVISVHSTFWYCNKSSIVVQPTSNNWCHSKTLQLFQDKKCLEYRFK